MSVSGYYTKVQGRDLLHRDGSLGHAAARVPGSGPVRGAQIWAGMRAAGIRFPDNYTYSNLGTVDNKGVEFAVESQLSDIFSGL